MIKVTVENKDPSIFILFKNYQTNGHHFVFQFENLVCVHSVQNISNVTMLDIGDNDHVNVFLPLHHIVDIFEKIKKESTENSSPIKLLTIEINENQTYQCVWRYFNRGLGCVWYTEGQDGKRNYSHKFVIEKQETIEDARERFTHTIHDVYLSRSKEATE